MFKTQVYSTEIRARSSRAVSSRIGLHQSALIREAIDLFIESKRKAKQKKERHALLQLRASGQLAMTYPISIKSGAKSIERHDHDKQSNIRIDRYPHRLFKSIPQAIKFLENAFINCRAIFLDYYCRTICWSSGDEEQQALDHFIKEFQIAVEAKKSPSKVAYIVGIMEKVMVSD